VRHPSPNRPFRYVLDANALIGWLEDRTAVADRVDRLLQQALNHGSPIWMSAVNWGEVFYIEWRTHGEPKAREAEAAVQELPLSIGSADRDRASRAGALKLKYGLSYADAFAAELAIERSAKLVTADPGFAKVGKLLSVYPLPRHSN
jgi:predicted nucleic acid-binding protein